jgi:AraC-like DNA-binding protein
MTPASLLEVVFAIIATIGALLLWRLPRYRALAHYLAFLSVVMALNLLEGSGANFRITPVLTLVKGLLLYQVVRSLVNERPLRGAALALQFAPPLVLLLIRASPQLSILLGTISQIIYLALSFQLLRRYHRAARTFRSDAESTRLAWLGLAYGLIAVQVASGLVRLNLQPFLDGDILSVWFSLDIALLFGVCCFLLFKALGEPPLYDHLIADEDAGERGDCNALPEDSGGARSVFVCLEELIQKDELYRKPRLGVEDLSELTGLQMKDVSWAFNAGAGTSFNDYINRLRVEALKRELLVGVGRKSVLELAFAVGFNSKSSFNAIFKREVGMTPSQYMKIAVAEKSTAVEKPALRA